MLIKYTPNISIFGIHRIYKVWTTLWEKDSDGESFKDYNLKVKYIYTLKNGCGVFWIHHRFNCLMLDVVSNGYDNLYSEFIKSCFQIQKTGYRGKICVDANSPKKRKVRKFCKLLGLTELKENLFALKVGE